MATLSQILGGVICLFLVLIQTLKYKKEKKIPLWIPWFTFLAGMLVLTGTWISNSENNKFQKSLNNKADVLIGEKKSCYILFYGDPFDRDNNIYFQSKLLKIGNLPIYDINIMLFDLSKTIVTGNANRSVSDGRFINNSFNSQNLEVGNLSGGYKELPLVLTSLKQDFYHFFILISTRNGSMIQDQYFKYINNAWETSCLVYDYATKEIISKNASKNFPIDILDVKDR